MNNRIVEIVERLDDFKYCYRDESDIRWLVVERDRLLARVRELEAERPELWDKGLRAGMDSVLTAHERLADSRADWLPPVPANPYRTEAT